ncbi:MAG TPA: succinate dehydrogenase, cytochrome b556 subunit [Gammaproteobacteria bacterium]|nr:succinate dehydrogenase, cytochrome b556 subunit [Gammaproteobacteria bacterium]
MPRPLSPHIQIYRPQLTSVLSILHRITGALLVLAGLGLVAFLWAAASGPDAYAAARGTAGSWPGRVVLFVATFAFFLHLCGGIRHLVWDSTRWLRLEDIYVSGWTVVLASAVLTVVAWVVGVAALA